MYFYAVAVVSLALYQGISPDRNTRDACHIQANSSCQGHAHDNMTYCASDGTKYHGLCALLLATCDHHLSVVGYGENCIYPTAHPQTTSSTNPPGQMDLYSHLTHGIDDRLAASRAKRVPPEVAKHIFSKQDDGNKSYVRNRDCWTYGLDLTPLSPWNSDLGKRKGGTLVSPRHIIGARHYNAKVNSTVRFVDLNNKVIERTVIKKTIITGPNIQGLVTQDMVVGELDSDVPNTISFAKVMPKNQTIFQWPYNLHVPALSIDLEEKALVYDVYFYSQTFAGLLEPSLGSLRHTYSEQKTSGDSGNPSFFILDNELVIWLLFDSVNGGLIVNHYFDQINDIMVKEPGRYRLTEIDLSKFMNQSPHLIG